MIKKLLFTLVVLMITNAVAQEKKWSIETNYSLIPSEGLGGSNNILELGIRYRFADFEFFNLGIGLNGGYFIGNNSVSIADEQSNTSVFQPRIFSEFNLPFSKKLKPHLGLGYSYVNVTSPSDISRGGFNFNFGISYDISDRWFIQLQYDFINLMGRDLGNSNFEEKLNNIKLGVGFRF